MKEHYFQWNIRTFYQNGEREGVGAMSGADTLEQALANGIEAGTYYVLECGYIVTLDVQKTCARCDGSGEIRTGKRVIRTKTCPDCRGQGWEKTLQQFPVKVHQNAVDRQQVA